MTIRIEGSFDPIIQDLDHIQRRMVPSVVVSSLTGTMRKVRKVGNQRLKSQLRGVPARVVNSRSHVLRAVLPTRGRQVSGMQAGHGLNTGGWKPLDSVLFVKVQEINLAKVAKVSTTKKGVRVAGRSYPGGFVRQVGQRRVDVVLYPDGRKLKSAKVDIRQPVDSIFGTLIQRAAPGIFQKMFRDRMVAKLRRKGQNSAADVLERQGFER